MRSPTAKTPFKGKNTMRCSILHVAGVLFALGTTASAATISFTTDPFEGSNARTTPGQQIVQNELFTTFDPATDALAFDPVVFGIENILFANDAVQNLPPTGVNFIVLRTFDNDANPATGFGAGGAHNLIADQLTESTAGFFIYFNSGLDVARLVFSTDLSERNADLKVLARFTNLTGQQGRDAFSRFSDENAALTSVPEPTSLMLVSSAGLAWLGRIAARRRRREE
jgi:hypothetical protein